MGDFLASTIKKDCNVDYDYGSIESTIIDSSWNDMDLPDEYTLEEDDGLDNEDAVTIFIKEKISDIELLLDEFPIDFNRLKELAISERGLINDDIRRRAWPHLMQVELKLCSLPDNDSVKLHKDYKQVVLDVNRSLKRFPPGINDKDRYILMDQLTSVIIKVLEDHSELHYYQGYHDVAITFLLVMGESAAFELVEKLSLTHLKEFMQPTMEKTSYYLTYLYPVLRFANEELYYYLVKSGVGTIFCLPWLITWYAHTLSDYRNVVRLYDFFLASPHLMPMYIAVAIVLSKEEEILSGNCDMASQHFILSQVPDSLPLEIILKKASELYSLCPPEDVREEVDEFIKLRKLEEEVEKQRLIRMREKKRLSSSNKSYILGGIFDVLFPSPVFGRRGKYFYAVSFILGVSVVAGFIAYYKDYCRYGSIFNS